MAKLLVSPDDWVLWVTHPLTQQLMLAVKDKKERDSFSFVQSCRLDAEPHTIERFLYKEVGKAEMCNKLSDKESIKTFLKDYIEIDN